MTLALLIALAAALGAGCVALAWAQVRRVDRAVHAPEALAIALKRVPEGDRLEELGRRAPPDSWERRMAEGVLEAPHRAAKIAAVNDALADLDHTLRAGAGWPPAAIRIAAFGGLLLAVFAYLASGEISGALIVVAVGAAAALACFEADRAARRKTATHRRDVDALVQVVLGKLEQPRTRTASEETGRPADKKPGDT